MPTKKVKVKAVSHPSGTYTLQQAENDGGYSDINGEDGLYVNRDQGDFYRKVAA